MRKRLQNILAESRLAFPVMMLYAILTWLLAGMTEQGLYLEFALFITSTFTMLLLNNSNSLIRIYSRMVSCSFIVMTCAAPFLFASAKTTAVQTCMALFYLSIARSYQDKRAPGIVFYSFAAIGTASLWFVQILYFIPFLWVIMASNLMALSNKMFWASIVGVVAPYWFIAPYYAWMGNLPALGDHFAQLAQFGPVTAVTSLDTHHALTLTAVALLAIIGIIHFLRNSYQDKIRTRMLFEMFITTDLLSLIFVALQPQHYDALLPMAIISTSCLYGHFAALTKTRWTNCVFIIIALMMLGLTAYNIFF